MAQWTKRNLPTLHALTSTHHREIRGVARIRIRR